MGEFVTETNMELLVIVQLNSKGRWQYNCFDLPYFGRVARLACWTQAQKGGQIAVATLSGNSFRQTVHTHRASVH